MFNEEALVCKIFEQAIEDYRNLKDKKIMKDRDTSGSFSVKEIEKFLKSKRSSYLLELINCDLTGGDILNKIQAQYQ